MDRTFIALLIRELGPGAGFWRPRQALASRVTSGSPALEVMTDLRRASPATIRPQAPIDAANQFMIARGVRLLLVADDRETVLGVITATEILGEKVYRKLVDIPEEIDLLNVFRRPQDIPQHIEDILAARPKAVWFQQGIRHDEVAQTLAENGIKVVQDLCLMVEHRYFQ